MPAVPTPVGPKRSLSRPAGTHETPRVTKKTMDSTPACTGPKPSSVMSSGMIAAGLGTVGVAAHPSRQAAARRRVIGRGSPNTRDGAHGGSSPGLDERHHLDRGLPTAKAVEIERGDVHGAGPSVRHQLRPQRPGEGALHEAGTPAAGGRRGPPAS